MNKMNILSLFDGVSCGQLALNRVGINYNNYYASEIDKSAMKVTQSNFPSTIQLGDIKNWKNWNIDWVSIDLVLSGFCCQSFSFSGKGLNFQDERGKLFFIFAEILNHIKQFNPDVLFLAENVVMKKEYEAVINDCLGVEPILIDSALVSAQMRKRLYWTNIKNVQLPDDYGIKLIDILEDDSKLNPGAIRGRYLNKATIVGRRLNENGQREDYNKAIPITQCLEVRKVNRDKSNCLTTVDKDNVITNLPVGRYPDAFKNKLPYRYYTLRELCRLQTIPENYFDGIVSESAARKAIGNGWTVDIISHILRNINNECIKSF